MKTCVKYKGEKNDDDFYLRHDFPNARTSWCKKCFSEANSKRVAIWRSALKIEMVQIAGGKCMDCGLAFPPFVMDFDHREPSQKKFVLNCGKIRNRDKALEEMKKCDLVCSNCHRMRTHKQRCNGCGYCVEDRGQDGNAAVC